MTPTFNSDTLRRLQVAGLDPDRLPRHVAVIMDGNGRWAEQRGLPRIEGHRRGVQSVRSTIEECCRLGIGQLTLYCLSVENWKRPQAEIDFLMALLHEYLLAERAEILEQNIRFTTIGRRTELPDSVLREIDENIRLSQGNTGMTLCLAINYGGRTELVDAVRTLVLQVQEGTVDPDKIDENAIDAALYTAGMPDPDLLIRTAGEMRVSNFLLWQISYAELWVTEKCWPDFDIPTLQDALRDFGKRVRRFGGLKVDGMLQTRLWMGAILVSLTVGVLVVDQWCAPWYPFLLALVALLSFASTWELLGLLKPAIRPSRCLCMAGVTALIVANWLPHLPWFHGLRVWAGVVQVFAAFVLLTFLVEMATFREPGSSVTRMALAVWLVGYLGLLPSFLAQLRWLGSNSQSVAALALTIFVAKSCDIGAYFTGRLFGRHKMTPVLSPKKTWEGAGGGIATAVVAAILLDRLGPAPVLHGNLAVEIGFGLSVGIAGMLGDLAESLIKRDCEQKDASHAVPGFGGVLDVVDAILFAAPVSYLWFQTLC